MKRIKRKCDARRLEIQFQKRRKRTDFAIGMLCVCLVCAHFGWSFVRFLLLLLFIASLDQCGAAHILNALKVIRVHSFSCMAKHFELSQMGIRNMI